MISVKEELIATDSRKRKSFLGLIASILSGLHWR